MAHTNIQVLKNRAELRSRPEKLLKAQNDITGNILALKRVTHKRSVESKDVDAQTPSLGSTKAGQRLLITHAICFLLVASAAMIYASRLSESQIHFVAGAAHSAHSYSKDSPKSMTAEAQAIDQVQGQAVLDNTAVYRQEIVVLAARNRQLRKQRDAMFEDTIDLNKELLAKELDEMANQSEFIYKYIDLPLGSKPGISGFQWHVPP